ncbi:2-succinyl-5-enolpyruvyl-6-hydroxy-3-cyclohexene-1-carboxylate synthase [Thiorhodovibrio litoralis]|nr:2-succinyl-5-enolpyruvyl-6-hydroxy-3-cyclohexene-1-carboxylic-acid synthase [Thiorhodovibrio litoralis]WPL12039.1 2-succinyl-5-enolpyruvyl-6-hydroxy-3-cyclohexene-1-carboxylate synthase [Thiorhodovibrio litoralis]
MSPDAAPQSEDIGCLNLRWSLALLDGLMQGGLRHLVLSPGSRSTPLVLAAQRCPALSLTPILDERSAAFFALGLARASGEPVALLATSGSAPAHWYPAVIEAAHWGLGLVLLSADRPPLLRHSGANQTIDQTRLFGSFVREFHDPGAPSADPVSLKAMRALGLRVALQSQGPGAAPVHINLPFNEPLVPARDCPSASSDGSGTDAAQSSASSIASAAALAPAIAEQSRPSISRSHGSIRYWLPPGNGLIVCGPASVANADDAAAILDCAAHLGLPLLADPLSGLRFAQQPEQDPSPCVIRHYDALLRNPDAAARLKPDWVLRLGLAPVSKTLGEWLAEVPSWLVATRERWCDPSHDACGLIQAAPQDLNGALAGVMGDRLDARADSHWCKSWQLAEQRVEDLAAAHATESPWCEAQLIQQLLQAIAPGEGLLCANSLPIRQIETWSYPRREPLELFGNRGVSGIDGQLSTLAGLNAAGIPTWGLLGDLSFCHDLSGLLLTGELKRPVIVINNGGGRIFDYLPQQGLPDFARYWRTPVAPDLGELAKPFGLPHECVRDSDGLAAALADSTLPKFIEVQIDADQSRAMHLDFWQRVAHARLLGDAAETGR